MCQEDTAPLAAVRHPGGGWPLLLPSYSLMFIPSWVSSKSAIPFETIASYFSTRIGDVLFPYVGSASRYQGERIKFPSKELFCSDDETLSLFQ